MSGIPRTSWIQTGTSFGRAGTSPIRPAAPTIGAADTRIGAESAQMRHESMQTRHRLAGIVLSEGGGTTPHPWVGDSSFAPSAEAWGDTG